MKEGYCTGGNTPLKGVPTGSRRRCGVCNRELTTMSRFGDDDGISRLPAHKLPADFKPAEVVPVTDVPNKSDISSLPPHLQAQLRFGNRSEPGGCPICERILDKASPNDVTLNDVLIGYYNETGDVISRTSMAKRMSTLVEKGRAIKVSRSVWKSVKKAAEPDQSPELAAEPDPLPAE